MAYLDMLLVALGAPVLGVGSLATIKLNRLSGAVERLSAVMTQAAAR